MLPPTQSISSLSKRRQLSTSKSKTKTKSTKQHCLMNFGFKSKCIKKSENYQYNNSWVSTLVTTQSIQNIISNESRGYPLTSLYKNHIKILYMNINGIDLGTTENFLMQLCKTLQEEGVNAIWLKEKNFNWRSHYIIRCLSNILNESCPKKNIAFWTFYANLKWNGMYNLGGIAIVLTKKYPLLWFIRAKAH